MTNEGLAVMTNEGLAVMTNEGLAVMTNEGAAAMTNAGALAMNRFAKAPLSSSPRHHFLHRQGATFVIAKAEGLWRSMHGLPRWRSLR